MKKKTLYGFGLLLVVMVISSITIFAVSNESSIKSEKANEEPGIQKHVNLSEALSNSEIYAEVKEIDPNNIDITRNSDKINEESGIQGDMNPSETPTDGDVSVKVNSK